MPDDGLSPEAEEILEAYLYGSPEPHVDVNLDRSFPLVLQMPKVLFRALVAEAARWNRVPGDLAMEMIEKGLIERAHWLDGVPDEGGKDRKP